MREIAEAGLAESAHDLSDGGLAMAAAEACFGRAGVGAELTLDGDMRAEWLLFHEGPSRILVSTADPDAVQGIARRHSVEALRIGVTMGAKLVIRGGERILIDGDIGRLKELFEGALERRLRS